MYTEEDVIAMQKQAKELKLKYPECFIVMAPDELKKIANGYGPERWSKALRKIVTWIFRNYPAPAAIHDVRYEFSDGRELTRHAADAEFAANLILVWQNRYGFFRYISITAWYDRWKISKAADLTAKYGSQAWRESFKRQQKKNGNLEVEDE